MSVGAKPPGEVLLGQWQSPAQLAESQEYHKGPIPKAGDAAANSRIKVGSILVMIVKTKDPIYLQGSNKAERAVSVP